MSGKRLKEAGQAFDVEAETGFGYLTPILLPLQQQPCADAVDDNCSGFEVGELCLGFWYFIEVSWILTSLMGRRSASFALKPIH